MKVLEAVGAASDVHQPTPPRQGLEFRPGVDHTRVSRQRWPLVGLGTVLLVQLLLSGHFSDTAFTDEALSLWAGRLELERWMHGLHVAAPIASFASYFPGDPYLYPPISAAVGTVGGLSAARGFSMLLMILATTAVFGFGRRLFGVAAGLVAAILFGLSPSVLFLGHFATFDPLAVTLIASAGWLAVRARDSDRSGVLLSVLCGASVALGAVAEYTGLLFVPVVLMLVFLVFLPTRGMAPAAERAGATLLGASSVLALAYIADPEVLHGVYRNSFAHFSAHGVAAGAVVSIGTVLSRSLTYVGPMVLLGAIGLVGRWHRGSARSERVLSLTLFSAGLIVTVVEMVLHSASALFKAEAYGLPFLTVIAAAGLVSVVRKFRGRGVLVTGLVLGLLLFMSGATYQHDFSWPNETRMVHFMAETVHRGPAVYLTDNSPVFEYYLDRSTLPAQWISTSYVAFTYRTAGRTESGRRAFAAAIDNGYFTIVALTRRSTAVSFDRMLKSSVVASHRYRLLADVRERNRGDELWEIYVRRR